MVGFSTQMQISFDSYYEYWLYYKATHRNMWSNRLHVAGTALAAIWAFIGLLQLNWRVVAAAVGLGYTMAWSGDLLLEDRTPASFDHPLWAARANMDMCWDVLRGKNKV